MGRVIILLVNLKYQFISGTSLFKSLLKSNLLCHILREMYNTVLLEIEVLHLCLNNDFNLIWYPGRFL